MAGRSMTVLLPAVLLLVLNAFAAGDPARFEAEIRAFEAADRSAMPDSGVIVFTGSSSIKGWNSLAADLTPLPVVNRGFGGSQVSDGCCFLERIVVPYRPRAVVFYAGENDIWAGESADSVAEDFRRYVGKLRGLLPETPLYFIGLKPSPARWSKWAEMQRANGLIERICRESHQVWFIDLSRPMLGSAGYPRAELYVPDSLHLSPEGYCLWTAGIRPRLEGRSCCGRN